jgi:hypothetical protein
MTTESIPPQNPTKCGYRNPLLGYCTREIGHAGGHWFQSADFQRVQCLVLSQDKKPCLLVSGHSGEHLFDPATIISGSGGANSMPPLQPTLSPPELVETCELFAWCALPKGHDGGHLHRDLQYITDDKPKRVPVDYRYDAVNPTFLKWMARIGAYAESKYGAWHQYTRARLTCEKSPINHAYEHLRAYTCGERYDHFDGDPRWHLVAAAYNCMMSFYYHSKWGPEVHPLHIDEHEQEKKP